MTDIVLEVMRVDGPAAALARARGENDSADWSRGDIVRAFEAPAEWGRVCAECFVPRKCYVLVLDCPFTVEKAAAILEREETFGETVVWRRAICIPVAILPVGVRQALGNAPYSYTTSWDVVRNFILRRKADDGRLGDGDFA